MELAITWLPRSNKKCYDVSTMRTKKTKVILNVEEEPTVAPVAEPVSVISEAVPIINNPRRFRVLPVVGVAVVIVSIWFLSRNTDPKAVAEKEVKDLTAAVGSLMVLPEGEIPQIATVSDPSRLKGQEFFKNAKVGDKVLIYNKSKKAILYSPSIRKILDVAPLGNS